MNTRLKQPLPKYKDEETRAMPKCPERAEMTVYACMYATRHKGRIAGSVLSLHSRQAK